jgi:hypothetical protein
MYFNLPAFIEYLEFGFQGVSFPRLNAQDRFQSNLCLGPAVFLKIRVVILLTGQFVVLCWKKEHFRAIQRVN